MTVSTFWYDPDGAIKEPPMPPHSPTRLTAEQARSIAEEDQKALDAILAQVERKAKDHQFMLILDYHPCQWVIDQLKGLRYSVLTYVTYSLGNIMTVTSATTEISW